MTPILVLSILVLYFAALILISVYTSKGATSDTFFTANRQSPWHLVAFGMIGSSLSGITFVSVPGSVGISGFAYFQVVLGYLLGYWVIITVLMPTYYKLNLVSIYTYLEQRFDRWSYKTGAFFFLLSHYSGDHHLLNLDLHVQRRHQNHCVDGFVSNDLPGHRGCNFCCYHLKPAGIFFLRAREHGLSQRLLESISF